MVLLVENLIARRKYSHEATFSKEDECFQTSNGNNDFLINYIWHINDEPDVRKMSSPIRKPGMRVPLLFSNLFRLTFLIVHHIAINAFKEYRNTLCHSPPIKKFKIKNLTVVISPPIEKVQKVFFFGEWQRVLR